MGFDAKEMTPLLVHRVTFAAAETRSFKRASIVMKEVGDQTVSPNIMEWAVHDVGSELIQRRDADPKSEDALAWIPIAQYSTNILAVFSWGSPGICSKYAIGLVIFHQD
jgi:hypothetical protein